MADNALDVFAANKVNFVAAMVAVMMQAPTMPVLVVVVLVETVVMDIGMETDHHP